MKNRPPLVKLGLSPLGGRACFSNMKGQWMDTHHQYKRRNRVYYRLQSLALEQIDKGSDPDPTNHWSCNLQQIIHTSILWVVVCLFVTCGSQGWCQRLVVSWKYALWEAPLASHSWCPVDDGYCYHYCCCSLWAPSLHVSPIHGRASVLNNRYPCSSAPPFMDSWFFSPFLAQAWSGVPAMTNRPDNKCSVNTSCLNGQGWMKGRSIHK